MQKVQTIFLSVVFGALFTACSPADHISYCDGVSDVNEQAECVEDSFEFFRTQVDVADKATVSALEEAIASTSNPGKLRKFERELEKVEENRQDVENDLISVEEGILADIQNDLNEDVRNSAVRDAEIEGSELVDKFEKRMSQSLSAVN